METDDLERVVLDAVRDHLAFDGLESVDVARDFDSEGDPILRITIVLDEAKARLDPTKMLGVVRHIRAGLEGTQEKRFPLVSYLSKQDYSKRKREAA